MPPGPVDSPEPICDAGELRHSVRVRPSAERAAGCPEGQASDPEQGGGSPLDGPDDWMGLYPANTGSKQCQARRPGQTTPSDLAT